MSSGPVARWLETFVCTSMCKQYVEVFQEFGYNNLNEICNLSSQQLLKMGVTRNDMEKIMENVSVLKQTMQATTTNFNQGYSSSNTQLESEIASLVVNPTKQPGKKKAAAKAKNDKQQTNVTINQVVPNKKTKKGNSKADKNQVTASQNQPITNYDSNYLIDYNNNSSNYGHQNIDQKPNMVSSTTPAKFSSNYEFQNSQYNQYQQQQQQQQQNYRPHQHMQHYPQSKSPAILLSPISNPSSTSSISSSSSSCSTYSTSSSATNQALPQQQTPNHFVKQQQHQQNYKPNTNNTNLASNQSSYTNYNHNTSNNTMNYNSPNTNMMQHQQQQLYYSNNTTTMNSTSNYSSNGWNNNNTVSHSNLDYYNYNNNTSNNSYGYQQNTNNTAAYNSNPAFQQNKTPQQVHQQVGGPQAHSMSMTNNNSNKNSPLEYLERLALLPESVDIKHSPEHFDEILLSNNQKKRNLSSNNEDFLLNNNSKKVCSNNINSNHHNVPSSNQIQMGMSFPNQRANLILNESPSSSSSTTSSSSTSSSSFNGILPHNSILTDVDCDHLTDENTNSNNGNNIIDAANFDFLDYLPELNSTTIDQTITTATSFSNININNSDGLDLLEAAAADTDLSSWF